MKLEEKAMSIFIGDLHTCSTSRGHKGAFMLKINSKNWDF